MQLSPQTIRELCASENLINPFREHYKHAESGLSGGLSCAGYDVHLKSIAPAFREGELLFYDPPFEGNGFWEVPPRTGVLGVTEEKFTLPDDIAMSYFNKSTMARWFIEASATLAEPGWCGHLTLELFNATDRHVVLHSGQPIGQVVFHRLDQSSDNPYTGKYQNQKSVPVQGIKEVV